MFIVMVAPECAPAAKVGGLADVVHGLSKELSVRGHAVEIILPKYDCTRYDRIFGLRIIYRDLWVPYYGQWIRCDVFFGWVDGLRCFFIEPHSPHIGRGRLGWAETGRPVTGWCWPRRIIHTPP
jgi:starch synthase